MVYDAACFTTFDGSVRFTSTEPAVVFLLSHELNEMRYILSLSAVHVTVHPLASVITVVRLMLFVCVTLATMPRESEFKLSRTFVFQNAAVSTSPVGVEGKRRGRCVGYHSAYE
jgi:hypothetical protein